MLRVLLIIFVSSGCATPLSKLGLDTGYEGTGGGFLDGEEGSADGGPGDDCSGGGVLDCNLDCWVSDAKAYIGDDNCDTGQRGPDFDCDLMNFDDGDCVDSSDDDDGPEPADSGGETDDSTEGGEGSSDGDVGGDTDVGVSGSESTDSGDAGVSSAGGGETGDGAADPDTTGGGVTGGGETDSGATSAGSTDMGATDVGSADGGGGTSGSDSGGATGDAYDPSSGIGDSCVVMEEWTIPGYEIGFFGDVYPTTGTTGIGSAGYLDCAGTCVPNEVYAGHVSEGLLSDYVFFSWLGDEYCDAGGYGVDFACAYYEWDFGDCESDAVGGGTSDESSSDSGGDSSSDSTGDGMPTPGSACTADTPEGPVDGTTDCTGACFGVPYDAMMYYTTDGICDDGYSGTAIDLNCAEFTYDGGACDGDGGSGAPGVSTTESEY